MSAGIVVDAVGFPWKAGGAGGGRVLVLQSLYASCKYRKLNEKEIISDRYDR